jgi:hypothetical protein
MNNNLNRRHLFKVAGVGTALAATAALPVVGRSLTESGQSGPFAFRATLGLPEMPLPSYATYIVEGTLDLVNGVGLITSRMLAGHPDDPSQIGLPGLTRVIKVTNIDSSASELKVSGIVEDRSQLQPGESAHVDLRIDRARGVVVAPFGGQLVTLSIA